MVKRIRKMLNALVMTLLLVSTIGSQVFAAVPTEIVAASKMDSIKLDATVFQCFDDSGISTCATTFNKATITISYHSDSGMQVLILTYVNGVASVVGVKDISIQAKSGSNWVTVATSAGGELTNVQGMGCEVTYAGAVEGVTYRVVCTHYADYEGYRELYHESEGFECKY